MSDSVKIRMALNSPGSPVQCPAVTTIFGAMSVPEQRHVGTPATSITMRMTAGCASPSTEPCVINDALSPTANLGTVGACSHAVSSEHASVMFAKANRDFILYLSLLPECG